MFSIETGRGGWFHNFGGLSAPVNLWAAAYFTPGTYQSGFDTFCKSAQFNAEHTEFSGIFHNYGDANGALLVVMNDQKHYRVLLNGAPTDFYTRFDGMLEIPLPKCAEDLHISVQLV